MNGFKKLSLHIFLLFSVSAFPNVPLKAEGIRSDVPDGLKQERSAVLMQESLWLEQIAPVDDVLPEKAGKGEVKTVTNEDLIKHPELLHNLMVGALNSGDPHLLESLTAAYRKQPQADAVLLARAEGMIARNKGDYPQAVAVYTKLHQARPEDMRITLDTAAVLWEDRQWEEADRLFARAEAVPDLPEAVRGNILVYRRATQAANRWNIGGGISVAQNSNVNDAAPPYCTPLGCSSGQAESATGVNYRLTAEKNTPLKTHHNLLFRSHYRRHELLFRQKIPLRPRFWARLFGLAISKRPHYIQYPTVLPMAACG